MKILVTGATGLIGRHICEQLLYCGHQLTVITRSQEKYNEIVGLPACILEHDLMKGPLRPSPILESIDAIIHLAGENIAGSRWSEKFKQKLYDSRVKTTQHLLDSFIHLKQKKLSLIISASGIGVYSASDEKYNEQTPTDKNSSFFSRLCHEWEKYVDEGGSRLSARVIKVRLGPVLARQGGMLAQIEPYARAGILGRMPGKDFWISWIHIEDVVRGLMFCIENSQINGVINFTSPEPCLYSELIHAFNQTFKKKDFLSPPKFLLSMLHGEMINVLTKSHRILPQRLIDQGFSFHFPKVQPVFTDLYKDFLLPLRYEGSQWVPKDKNTVFDFYSSVQNIEKITPPWLKFQVNTPSLRIKDNLEIDYKIGIYGLNIKAKTKVVICKPPDLFVDEEIKGLFHKWRHSHKFISLAGGTLIQDSVNYQLPYGLSLLGSRIAKNHIKKMFDHRHKMIFRLLK